MVTSAGTTPDAIGWRFGSSILIEVKISRSDFFADRKKLAFTLPSHAMGTRRYYLTPKDLVKPEDLPEDWGLLYADGPSIVEVVEAPVRVLHPRSHEQEANMLCSAIRRLQVGGQFRESTGRWQPLEERLEVERLEREGRKLPDASPMEGQDEAPGSLDGRFLLADGWSESPPLGEGDGGSGEP